MIQFKDGETVRLLRLPQFSQLLIVSQYDEGALLMTDKGSGL
jgi:hypothetical protein